MLYKLIEKSYPRDLEREVNVAIKQGWKPIGGVCSDTSYGCGRTLYQAMIFVEDEE